MAISDARPSIPDNFVKALNAAVKVAGDAAWLVVGGKGVSLPVEGEAAMSDAVAVSTDEGAEIGGVDNVFGDGMVPEGDIGELSVAVGYEEPGDDAAVIGDLCLHAVGIGEGVGGDGSAVSGLAKGAQGDCRSHRTERTGRHQCQRGKDRLFHKGKNRVEVNVQAGGRQKCRRPLSQDDGTREG